MEKRWITTPEACKLMGVVRHTIYRYIKHGVIDAKRIKGIRGKWFIDILSIPTFLRQKKEVGNK